MKASNYPSEKMKVVVEGMSGWVESAVKIRLKFSRSWRIKKWRAIDSLTKFENTRHGEI